MISAITNALITIINVFVTTLQTIIAAIGHMFITIVTAVMEIFQ